MANFQDAIERNRTYEYYINLDERGEFFADVRTHHGRTVYTINGGDIFEDGFMKHKNDIAGLESYMKDLGIITQGGRLINGN